METPSIFRLAAVAFLPLISLSAANPPIRYLPDARVWVLDAGETTYVLGVNERTELQHVYWGTRIGSDRDWKPVHSAPQRDSVDPSENATPDEYPGWGGLRFFEPCLKIALADGVRDLVLKYSGYEIHGEDLTIRLRDVSYDIEVELAYHMYPEGVLRKQATIRNRTSQVVTVESAQSGAWRLPAADGYRLTYLTGRWAEEFQLTQEDIHPGVKVLESRRGSTSNQMNPWFAIDGPERATEDHGEVWFGALGWSGNWRIAVEQTPQRDVRITGGYNTFDFAYPLKPGESLSTPPFYAGFTSHGLGEASRVFHRFQLANILPRASSGRLRPVLYNSWEATFFNVDEAGQMALAEKAARIGVERFVMDDGWFGARDNSRAGLGDWTPNSKKFPHGLGPLIERVHKLGMDFGLWVEPEMVNPDSDLYRAHPDWVLNFPGRPRSEARNQLVLNLARDDVREYIFSTLDKLVSENDIAFLKWDFNRSFSEPGWPEAPPAEQRMVWVRYVTHYYEIIDRLRAKHPKLEIESCSSGGGRVDLGILTRTEQVWTSDNTDAFDRLFIQDGFSHAYTPKIMMAWVTDVPNIDSRVTPLSYRFLVAMMGSLGIGANLNKWSEDDFTLASKMIAAYKDIRATVQEGGLYRLAASGSGPLTANEYVSKEGKQAVVFAFLHAQQYKRPAPTVHLAGLDEQAIDRVRMLRGRLAEQFERVSGATLMNRGLTFILNGEFDAAAAVLERVGTAALPGLANSSFEIQAEPSGLASLKRANDRYDTDYIAAGRALGNVLVRYKPPADKDWQTALYATAAGQSGESVSYHVGRGIPTLATSSKASASTARFLVRALNDQIESTSSSDETIPRFMWFDRRGTREWVQYDFPKPESISSAQVYWAAPAPQSWRLLYRDGEDWKEVRGASSYGVALDRYNEVTFEPVSTPALRLEAQLQAGETSGILEWRVNTSQGRQVELQKDLDVAETFTLRDDALEWSITLAN